MAWIRGTAWHRGLSQRSALHMGSRSGPAGWKRLCGFARELCGLLGSRKPLAGVRHGEGRLLCAYHTQRDTSRAPAWMTWGAPFFTITSLSPGGCSRCFVAVTGAEGKGCGPVNWHTPVCAGGGCWHPSAHRATSWNHPESLRATRNDRNVWQLGSNCGFCEPGRGGQAAGPRPGPGEHSEWERLSPAATRAWAGPLSRACDEGSTRVPLLDGRWQLEILHNFISGLSFTSEGQWGNGAGARCLDPGLTQGPTPPCPWDGSPPW